MDVEHHVETTNDAAGREVPESPTLPIPAHRPTGASLVVLLGVAAAFCGVMLLHAISSDVDPIRDVMSHYANGSHGRYMSVVFYAFGVAAIAMAVRLRTAVDWHGLPRIVPGILALAGAQPDRRPGSSRSIARWHPSRWRRRSTATPPSERSC